MVTIVRIDMNRVAMIGKPVTRGTRITVALILRKLAEGATAADLIGMYPQLSERDICSVCEYPGRHEQQCQ